MRLARGDLMHDLSLGGFDGLANSFDLDLSKVSLPFMTRPKAALCPRTFVHVMLDPFNELKESDRTNNYEVFAVSRNCSYLEDEDFQDWWTADMCRALPDYDSIGKEFDFMYCYKSYEYKTVAKVQTKTNLLQIPLF